MNRMMIKKKNLKRKPDVIIDNRSDESLPPVHAELINRVVAGSLKLEKVRPNVEISLSIVNDAEMRELNRLYRDMDKTTDVLSFPFCDMESLLNNRSNQPVPLGDIVISIQKAREQATEYGHSLEREIGFLTAHSMLHLLGYDHINEEDERIMQDKCEQILSEAGLCRGLGAAE